MGITRTALAIGESNADATSYSTSSVSPAANTLILLWVYSTSATGVPDPTVSGCGLTWVKVDSATLGGVRKVLCFRAMGSSPSAGTITVNWGVGNTQTGWFYAVEQYDGVDTTGSNGANAIVQSNSNTATGATSITVTLSAIDVSGRNLVAGACGSNVNTALTAGSAFTTYGAQNHASPASSFTAEWDDNSTDNTVDFNCTSSATLVAIALEIKVGDYTLTANVGTYFFNTLGLAGQATFRVSMPSDVGSYSLTAYDALFNVGGVVTPLAMLINVPALAGTAVFKINMPSDVSTYSLVANDAGLGLSVLAGTGVFSWNTSTVGLVTFHITMPSDVGTYAFTSPDANLNVTYHPDPVIVSIDVGNVIQSVIAFPDPVVITIDPGNAHSLGTLTPLPYNFRNPKPTIVTIEVPAVSVSLAYTITPDPVVIELGVAIPDARFPSAEEQESLFLHNWETDLVVVSGFNTAVTLQEEGHEARRGLISKPVYSMQYKMQGLSMHGYDASLMHRFLLDRSTGQYKLPLLSDYVKLTATGSAGTNVLSVTSTLYRRLFAGREVLILKPLVIHDLGESTTRWYAELATISMVSENEISLESNLRAEFPAGSRVYCAMKCHPEFQGNIDPYTSWFAQGTHIAQEVLDTEAIPAIAESGTVPDGEQTYFGIPILTQKHNWQAAKQGIFVDGVSTKIGLDLIQTIYGFAKTTGSAEFTCKTRGEFWRLKSFFDSRGGRLHPFWHVPASRDYRPVDLKFELGDTSGRIDVDRDFARGLEVGGHLAFVLASGRYVICKILTITEVGVDQDYRVIVEPEDPFEDVIDDTTVIKVSRAYLGRWDTDEFTETWKHDSYMTTSLPILEVCQENEAECDAEAPTVTPPNTEDTEPGWLPCIECSEPSTVIVPTTSTPCESCDPERPPLQASNFTMPQKITVTIGAFSKDPNHSHAGALANALLKMQGRHELEYDDDLDADNVTSRHWHHLRVVGVVPGGATWDLNTDPSYKRRIWQKVVPYTGDDEQPYTLVLRFYVEWDPNRLKGCWDVAAMLIAFTDECNPTYVDGNTFDGYTFTREDPCVWDPLALDPVKRVHPQALFAAHIPTTMESPCGEEWHEPHEQDACFEVLVGTPWNENYDEHDAIGNSVFGDTAGSYDCGAVTLGADCPQSGLLEWVTIENGNAEGITAFSPAAPGWNDPEGGLILQDQSSITIEICQPPAEESCCDPDNVLKASQNCFRTQVEGAYARDCCYPTAGTIDLTIVQKCIATTGPDTYVAATYEVTLTGMRVRSCNYSVNDAGLRYIEWYKRVIDPDYVLHDNIDDFSGMTLTDWDPVEGGWLLELGVVKTKVAGPNELRHAMLRTGPISGADDIPGGSAQFVVRRAGRAYGILARYMSGNGYLATITDENVAQIWRFDSGVGTLLAETVLDDVGIDPPAVDDQIRFIAFGTSLQLYLKGLLLCSCIECTQYTTGAWGIGDTSILEDAEYDDWVFLETNENRLEATVTLTEGAGLSIVVPAKMMPGYVYHNCVNTEGTSRYLAPEYIDASISNETTHQTGYSFSPLLGQPPDLDVDCPDGSPNPIGAWALATINFNDAVCTFDDETETCDMAQLWYVNTCVIP